MNAVRLATRRRSLGAGCRPPPHWSAVVLLVLLCICTPVNGVTYELYVDCDNGLDEPDCGSVGSPCSSISYALSICNGNSTAFDEYAVPVLEETDFYCNITILPSICTILESETMLVPENTTIVGLMGSEFTKLQLSPASIRDVGFHIPNGRGVTFEGLGFSYNSSMFSKLIFIEEVPFLARFVVRNCTFTCVGNNTAAAVPAARAISEPSILNFRHSENNGEVHINGTTFRNHRVALCIDGAGSVIMNDCLLENNDVRLMDMIAASVLLRQTIIRNNTDASVMITMDGESRLVLDNTTVSYNRAQSLMYMGDVSTPTLQSRIALLGSMFDHNEASYCVNGVSLDVLITSCTFVENDLTMLYVTNSNVYVEDTSVSFTASNKSSVTVSIHDDGLSTAPFYSLIIVGCEFLQNAVRTSGGAVRASAFAKQLNVFIEDSTFEGNSANNGGALMIDGNCAVQLLNSSFVDNSATQQGNAIFCTSAAGNATVQLDNGNVFVNNSTYTDDDDDDGVNSAQLIYNDPAHACGIYCTEEMEAMCETGAADYPPSGFTISVLAVLTMVAIVALVIFSAYCYVWVKDVKRFSDYEVVGPE